MKTLAYLIPLILGCYSSYAQSPRAKVLLPQIDSMVVDMDKLFINPNNIKSLDVLKDPSTDLLSQHRDAYISMTFKKTPRLVILNSLKVDSIEKKSNRISYVIDGQFITDTTQVKIDVLNIKKLNALFTGNTPGLYVNQTGTVYIITTKSKGKKIKQTK